MSSITLLDSVQSINKQIQQIINENINEALHRTKRRFDLIFRKKIVDAIKLSETYQEIISGGPLLGELGIPQPDLVMNSLLERWADSVLTRVDDKTNTFEFMAVKADFSDVLNAPVATFISRVSRKTIFSVGQEIPWLKWLITEGTKKLIQDFKIRPSSRGRTGVAVMTPSSEGWGLYDKESDGVSFNSAKHAGTIDDNFVTRALDASIKDLELVAAAIFLGEFTK